MSPAEERFVQRFEEKVKNTLKEGDLASRKEKVLVACSGGKDSTAVLYLMKKFGYNVEAIILDLLIGKYSEENLENVKNFCQEQKVKLHVVDYRKELGYSVCYLRSAIQAKEKIKNCHVCGVMKKHLLNKKARQLKAKKLATGHNLDDEAQTFLMNMLRGNPELSASAGPKTANLSDEKFVARIKPLSEPRPLGPLIRRLKRISGCAVPATARRFLMVCRIGVHLANNIRIRRPERGEPVHRQVRPRMPRRRRPDRPPPPCGGPGPIPRLPRRRYP